MVSGLPPAPVSDGRPFLRPLGPAPRPESGRGAPGNLPRRSTLRSPVPAGPGGPAVGACVSGRTTARRWRDGPGGRSGVRRGETRRPRDRSGTLNGLVPGRVSHGRGVCGGELGTGDDGCLGVLSVCPGRSESGR